MEIIWNNEKLGNIPKYIFYLVQSNTILSRCQAILIKQFLSIYIFMYIICYKIKT